MIAQTFAEHGDVMCQIIGFVEDDLAKKGTVVDIGSADAARCKVLVNSYALLKIISQHYINTLVVAGNVEANSKLAEILADCLQLGMRTSPMPV